MTVARDKNDENEENNEKIKTTEEFLEEISLKNLNVEPGAEYFDDDIPCEKCIEKFPSSSILRHISRISSCKTFYGSRLIKMK